MPKLRMTFPGRGCIEMDRTVVITGGFGALGREVAQWFADLGDRVVRLDFAPPPAGGMPSGMLDIGGVDLGDARACEAAISRVGAEMGGIGVLVNIAGGFAWETLMDGDIETWVRMQSMNLMTAATVTKIALPLLLSVPDARIINIGAGAAVRATSGMGAYAASKSGVHRMTEALADELAGHDITVNAILPSIIDTPANRADMPDADFSQWVKPQAIAEVIGFLASPAARSISGALVPVTRGG